MRPVESSAARPRSKLDELEAIVRQSREHSGSRGVSNAVFEWLCSEEIWIAQDEVSLAGTMHFLLDEELHSVILRLAASRHLLACSFATSYQTGATILSHRSSSVLVVLPALAPCGLSGSVNDTSSSLIHAATRIGDPDRLAMMCAIDPAYVDARAFPDHETPLWLAAYCGSRQAAEVLLDWGADPHTRDGTLGLTCLEAAIQNDNVDVVELLRQRT